MLPPFCVGFLVWRDSGRAVEHSEFCYARKNTKRQKAQRKKSHLRLLSFCVFRAVCNSPYIELQTALKFFERGLALEAAANLFGQREPFDLHRGRAREIGVP